MGKKVLIALSALGVLAMAVKEYPSLVREIKSCGWAPRRRVPRGASSLAEGRRFGGSVSG
jgi:hypothetical protein